MGAVITAVNAVFPAFLRFGIGIAILPEIILHLAMPTVHCVCGLFYFYLCCGTVDATIKVTNAQTEQTQNGEKR
jgi:hypothetical protein